MLDASEIKPRETERDRVHVPFVTASLLFGVFGGFLLAVSLPVERAVSAIDVSWVAHAQIHGHLQLIGFAGLFVLGMAMRLAPHFGRGNLAYPTFVRPAFVLLVLGLLLRAIGQPLAQHDAFGIAMVSGAVLEAIAAAAFLAIVTVTLLPMIRTMQPHALFLCSGLTWFAVQAVLGVWWLTMMALDGGSILQYQRNSALVNLQLFGFVLASILGVGWRSFPTLFGMPAPARATGVGSLVLLDVGLLLWAAPALAGVTSGEVTLTFAAIGVGGVGLGIVIAVATFGLGRLRHRLAPASRGFVWALQPVLAWLLFTGLALILAGARGAMSDGGIDAAEIDAIRHIFALGVVTLAIVAMAQLLLPEFASDRMAHPPAPWRGAAFGVALSMAAVLRGVLPWIGLHGRGEDWAMATGATIALIAVAVFGGLYRQARRRHLSLPRTDGDTAEQGDLNGQMLQEAFAACGARCSAVVTPVQRTETLRRKSRPGDPLGGVLGRLAAESQVVDPLHAGEALATTHDQATGAPCSGVSGAPFRLSASSASEARPIANGSKKSLNEAFTHRAPSSGARRSAVPLPAARRPTPGPGHDPAVEAGEVLGVHRSGHRLQVGKAEVERSPRQSGNAQPILVR